MYYLKGINIYKIYIQEDVFFGRICFCKVKFHEFLQIETTRENKILDLFSDWIAKANGLRKSFAHDFSKKNRLVCVCVCVCLCVCVCVWFFSKFFCKWDRNCKISFNNLSKMADTRTNQKQNIPRAVTMYHDHRKSTKNH